VCRIDQAPERAQSAHNFIGLSCAADALRRVNGPADGRRTAARAVAIVRVAALPVVFVGERLVKHPEVGGEIFDWLLALAGVYALCALLATFAGWGRRIPAATYPLLDLAFLLGLTYTSGGAFSQVRLAFFLLPVGAAFLMSPRGTALWSTISIASYLGVSLTHPATNRGEDFEFVLSQALYLALIGVAAVLLAIVLAHRARRVGELAAGRGRLLAEILGAEERERKRLAEALHDDAVQDLLAAGQDLDDAERGDRRALQRARAEVRRSVAGLREAISDLHPYVLEQAGLEAALHSLVERRRRAGTRWILEVDPHAVGAHDRLVVSLARELTTNAAKHAGAAEVRVSLKRVGPDVLLEVADDGRGFDRELVRAAVSNGHVGLASCAERAEAAGGWLELKERPGGGTVASAWLPGPRGEAPRAALSAAKTLGVRLDSHRSATEGPVSGPGSGGARRVRM
jgi:two-component system, NarL family, sensor kinase